MPPDIDVTDVLLGSEIAGKEFVVIRREESVNNYGELCIKTARLPAFGAVAPTGNNSLLRDEAFQTQAKTIQIVTPFALRGEGKDNATGKNFQPDLVIWRGDYFLVRVVDDFSQYGQGFVRAECSSQDYVDVPPA